ncbi:hypothetical protein, partial [Mesorhizobium sp. M7A.F.Ca.US.006.01.1.1]|uniref:hypothetical protein n=1 Tax=Mesorhizobium sp. M7A.F.Ca.US.006.01.1.1 TaxID=2496707 RepID=UPI0019D1DE77
MVLFAKRVGIPGEIAPPPPLFARIGRHFDVCAAANHVAAHKSAITLAYLFAARKNIEGTSLMGCATLAIAVSKICNVSDSG